MVEAVTDYSEPKESEIPDDIIKEANEICRHTEVLPDGPLGLAARIHEARKAGRPLRVKFGVDPTSTDLHLGHAVVFRRLKRFQEFGHQVVLIIGGLTAQVGDPSGRNATRKQLTAETVKEYAQTYIDQLGLVLDIDKTEVTNNADWLASMNFAGFLELASKVTVNRLIAKEAFGNRLENQQPVHFHELFYPLLQAYDSVAIKADVELGGNDQRFNLLQGRELQPHYGQSPQVVMMLPLLVGTDGEQKMSKSYDNYIGLKEAPDDMFGKVMRIPDNLLYTYFELCTDLTSEEVEALKLSQNLGANPKDIKQRLAREIIKLYHGQEAADAALLRWDKIHSKGEAPDDMAEYTIRQPIELFRLLSQLNMAKSNGDAKRLIIEGGVRIDNEQIKDPNYMVEVPTDESKTLQIGRRKFVRLIGA